MSDRPFESWIRDAIFDDPLQIVRLLRVATPAQVTCWREFQVECGRIDVLIAWEDHAVIVEVKRDVADEGAVAQVLRYRGAVDVHLTYGHSVVVAPRFTAGARYAALAADVYLITASPMVKLAEDMDDAPYDESLYAELRKVTHPGVVPVVESGESSQSSDDLPALVRRDSERSEDPCPF